MSPAPPQRWHDATLFKCQSRVPTYGLENVLPGMTSTMSAVVEDEAANAASVGVVVLTADSLSHDDQLGLALIEGPEEEVAGGGNAGAKAGLLRRELILTKLLRSE